jgi:LysR family transcriptional regulator, regulator for bpeEF and oprC
MDRFQEMLVFRRVVEAGNVTRAAEALHVSQPAVSRTLAGLEARLGVALLRRHQRGVQPTEAGRAFFNSAVELLDRLDDAEAAAGSARAALTGPIRIASVSLLFSQLLAPMLPAFLAEHPGVTIDALLGSTPVDIVAENVDLALRGGRPGGQELKFRKLGTLEFALYAAPEYLAAHGAPAEPTELAAHAMIGGVGLTAGAHWPLEGPEGAALSLAVSPRHRCDELAACLALAQGGLGITMATRPLAAAHRLMRVLPGWRLPASPVFVVWPAQRHMPARVRALLDAMLAALPARLAGVA